MDTVNIEEFIGLINLACVDCNRQTDLTRTTQIDMSVINALRNARQIVFDSTDNTNTVFSTTLESAIISTETKLETTAYSNLIPLVYALNQYSLSKNLKGLREAYNNKRVVASTNYTYANVFYPLNFRELWVSVLNEDLCIKNADYVVGTGVTNIVHNLKDCAHEIRIKSGLASTILTTGTSVTIALNVTLANNTVETITVVIPSGYQNPYATLGGTLAISGSSTPIAITQQFAKINSIAVTTGAFNAGSGFEIWTI